MALAASPAGSAVGAVHPAAVAARPHLHVVRVARGAPKGVEGGKVVLLHIKGG